jgi:tetratricopeptide (TPR) repeat protein
MRTLRIFVLAALGILGTASNVLAATAADYYQAGLKLYTAQDYSHALPYLSAALKLEPNNSQALQVRGYCYYSLGQYQEALADYQKLLSLNPSDAKLTAFIGQINAKIRAAASRKNSPAAKTSAAVPAGAGTSASTAPAASAGTTQSQLSPELESLRDGRIAVMKDFLKSFWKANQKWPENLDELRTFLEEQPSYKAQAWVIWSFLNLTFSETSSGGVSVKFGLKHDAGTMDVQFTMAAFK